MWADVRMTSLLGVLCCCCPPAAAGDEDAPLQGHRDPLKVAAFNVRVLGQKKIGRDEVVAALVRIILQYDIILIQEIRDSKGTAIKKLLGEVRKKQNNYDMKISDRLGRSRSKEQYAFIYRTDKDINVLDTYQDPDTEDRFERPPYAVKFGVPWLGVSPFVLVAIHVDPDTAEEEINALVPVHASIERHWNTEDILIMGDFNADGSYLSKSKLQTLELRKGGFNWLLADGTDTTVAQSDNAYDRFVMTGEKFLNAVIPESIAVFRFDDAFDMNKEEAEAVSDHYPIELSLQPAKSFPTDSQDQVTGCGIIDSIINAFRRWTMRDEL